MNRALFFNFGNKIAWLLAFWLGASLALAQPRSDRATADAELAKADKAYDANRFDEALPIYHRMLEQERVTSPRILNRLALMEETRGHVPQALYYLNLLYTLQPDEGVRTRMESLARQYQLDGYDMDEWDFIRKLLRRFAPHLFAFVVFGITILIGILWYRRYRGKPLRLLPLAIILLLMLVSAALNLDVHYGKAIVIEGKAALMDDASAASHLEALIPPGTRLTVIGEQDAWMHVVYKDKQGYVSRNVIWYF